MTVLIPSVQSLPRGSRSKETFPAFSSPQQIKPVQILPVTETFDSQAEEKNTFSSPTSSMGYLDRNNSCSEVPAVKVTNISAQKVKPKGHSKPKPL